MPTTEASDGAAVRIPPPLVYLLAIVLGFLLQWLVFPLPLELPFGVRSAVGSGLAALGLGLLLAAVGRFRSTGQNPAPWTSTPEIIGSGIYRFTRNPMYVGMALVQAGIGVGAANGWILALLPLVLVIVQTTAIRHEEAYLAGKFGEPYLAYKRSVRRWL